MKDTGSFRAYRFALTPNQFIPGRHIRSVVTGRVDGSYSFAFFAVASWPKLFFPDRHQVQPVADHRLPGHLRRLDQVRAAALLAARKPR